MPKPTSRVSPEWEAFACLPFLQVPEGEIIELGPFRFWSAADYKDQTQDHAAYAQYLEHLRHIRVEAAGESRAHSGLETADLPLTHMCCVSIDARVPQKRRTTALANALYLLYFALTVRELYYDLQPMRFDPFGVVIPADEALAQNSAEWQERWIPETARRQHVKLEVDEPSILRCLGNAMTAVYTPEAVPEGLELGSEARLVRSLRYFVDRYFKRFHCPFKGTLDFPHEPENVVFLATSFDALLGLEPTNKSAQLKRILRSLLSLCFSRSVEMLWNWVDGFYQFKNDIVHAELDSDPQFTANPFYRVSFRHVAVKMFIYTVTTELINKFQDNEAKAKEKPGLADHWLDRREISYLFWPIDALLQQIAYGLGRVEQVGDKDNYISDLRSLMHIYVTVYRNHLEPKGRAEYHPVRFQGCDLNELRLSAMAILDASKRPAIKDMLVPEFLSSLKSQFS